MNILKALVCSAALVMPALAMAVHPRQYPDTFLIPERAIILTGNRASAGRLVAVLYNQEDMHFNEPNCPRFLFLDREGKIALGIGGYAKVSFQYDVRGSIDQGANFIPYDIPVPNRDDQESAFYANANHSSIFLQLVGRNDKIGTYQLYILGDFTGNGYKGYGFRLKQAYMSAGYFTVGLANSTLMDAAVGTPGIDNIGPSGETFRRNVLVRFNPHFGSHWSAAISIENPPTSYSTDEYSKHINPRCPDIPAYVQYAWLGGKSHVRLSGLFRSLSYRNLVAEKNKSVTGWAAQLSVIRALTAAVTALMSTIWRRVLIWCIPKVAQWRLRANMHSKWALHIILPRIYTLRGPTPKPVCSAQTISATKLTGVPTISQPLHSIK